MKEERIRILKMVEEGKLTVEEALTLLETLEQANQSMEQKKADIINELSTTVKFDEEKKQEQADYKFQSAKDKFVDFVDSAFKKIKDFDLDFNFGQSVNVSHIFHQGNTAFSEIDIDVANGSVKLIPWDQKDIRVECEAKVYRVDGQDAARKRFLEEVFFAVEGEKLRFATQQRSMKVNASIFVPAEGYKKVKVRLFNGPIQADRLITDDCTIKTANGKIRLGALSCGKLEAETANGAIEISGSKVKELEAETINGAIKLDGSYHMLDVQTFNGNISCLLNNHDAAEIEAKATTGSIELFVPGETGVKGVLKSNLGGFSVELEGIKIVEDKSEMVQKLLRFESVNEGEHQLKLNAETKTGAISVKKSH